MINDPMPIVVDETLTPCPKRHWLFGLCVGPSDHPGVHAVWDRGQWISWTEEQCSKASGAIVCEDLHKR